MSSIIHVLGIEQYPLFLQPNQMHYLPSGNPFSIPQPEIQKLVLANKAEFYPLCRGNVTALKLELTFPAGRPFEDKIGLASATLQGIKGGTLKRSATRLADGFDHWGSSLNFDFYIDTCGIKLFVLEKYLPRVLPLLVEMLSSPSFPEGELRLYKRQQLEKLRSDDTRADVVAYRKFTENLFGPGHPYGYNSTAESIGQISREDLICHYRAHYDMKRCKIYLSGQFSEQTRDLVAGVLGSVQLNEGHGRPHIPTRKLPKPSQTRISLEHAVQSSIRIGRVMFRRNHPDYEKMFVLNTLLGGYYGSRLMQNLREKKGLTYHIYSSLDTFLYGGYFLISTEVDKGRSELALREIRHEIEKLQNRLIGNQELQMVKNYLRGSFLHYFENAFAYGELIRTLSLEGGIAGYRRLVEGVEKVTPAELRDLALKYFQEKDLSLVQVS